MTTIRCLLLLCLASCTPHVVFKNNSPAIISGKLSCYNGNCCWPYIHHREVKDYHLMMCTHETIKPDGWHSADLAAVVWFKDP